MSDIFGISVSALQAFQSAITVTGNNIANASTPGYSRESILLSAAPPQGSATLAVGDGVVVNGITRSFNQATANQLNRSQSSLGQLNALQTYSSQIDNLVGTTADGLSTAVQGFYNAWSDVANSPTSTASRQALLGKAQSVASSFQSTSSQLDVLNTDINSRITADVQQINAYAGSIAKLNAQIVASTAGGGGQVPNDLIDQRDQAVSNLSNLTAVATTTDSNGALNVFVGNGQPLVLQGITTALTTIPNQFDASQLEVSTATSNGNVVSGAITSGDLGGLLAARSQIVNPARNQLGQIATAFAQTVNWQQSAGLDLSGKFGTNLFTVGAPLATPSSKNTGGVTVSASLIPAPGAGGSTGSLTAHDYVLAYQGGGYSLTNAADGSPVPFAVSGTTISADGLNIILSGTPASGDKFLIKPTAQAAGSFSVALGNPSQIAAAGAVLSVPAAGNSGTATFSSGTVSYPTNANLLTPTRVQFLTPTTYSVNGAGSFTATGGLVSLNGWQVQISGTPTAGDGFTVQGNVGGTGDNRNALLGASQQSLPVLQNGTVSINESVSALITGVGSQAQQINTAQTAQAAVNTQAVNNQQSVSGVNLDEEAAKLLQWQQAYGAAAKALQIGSSLFHDLLTAVQAA